MKKITTYYIILNSKKMKKRNLYLTPVVKSVAFKVESGFAGSPGDPTNVDIPVSITNGVSTESMGEKSVFGGSSISYDGF